MEATKTSEWECYHCSFANFADMAYCEMCLLYRIDDLAKQHVNATTGIVSLLKKKTTPLNSSIRYCSPLPLHFSQHENWSCGYRNIQMLCSSLMQVQEFRSVLFDGSCSIPTLEEIQRWIEVSWKAQFDVDGAKFFNYKLVGKKQWIGTTECATLLRYFGIRAIVVDFRADSNNSSESGSSHKRKATDSNSNCFQERISDWMKRYYSCDLSSKRSKPSSDSSSNNAVVDTVVSPQQHKFPVYMQYMGHSLTVIGTLWQEESLKQLVVFNPAVNGEQLTANLRNNTNADHWKRQLLMDLKSLKKKEHQMLFVLPGIMQHAERERSKIIIGVSDQDPITSNI